MNPFLEGAPFQQMQRIMEYALEYHIFPHDHQPLHWLNIPAEQAIDFLFDAFFDSCVATQSAVIKAATLLFIYDQVPYEQINAFIIDARRDEQAFFISRLLDRLEETIQTEQHHQEQ